ncbi:MAG: tetratricopeptide repeat protein [Alphaproteobacteria bacterium]
MSISGGEQNRAPEKALAEAARAFQQGRPAEAEQICRGILDATPGNPGALHFLGILAAQSGDLASAAGLIEQAVQRRGGDANLHFSLATVYYRLGRIDDAATAFRRAIAVNPQLTGAHIGLGNILAESEDFGDAIAAYRSALASDTNNVEAYNNLGTLFQEIGNFDEAAAAYRSAIGIDPNISEIHSNLGNTLRAQGNLEQAIECHRRALAINPDFTVGHCNLANALAEQGQRGEAIAAYRRALAIDPENAKAHANLAAVLRTEGDFKGAEDAFRKAVSLDPEDDTAHIGLGRSMLDQGRTGDAITAFRSATELRRKPGAPGAGDGETFRMTSVSKLRHDIEQLRYLMAQGVLSPDYEHDVAEYERVLAGHTLEPGAMEPNAGHMFEVPEAARPGLARTYNRLVHVAPAPALGQGALNPALDRAAIEADYFNNAPGMTYFDGLLNPEALASLQRYCLESTIWFDFSYPEGYLSAIPEDGFYCPLVAQIAEELRLALPGIFGDHKLRKYWAFKCDSRMKALKTHADAAAVNVNFWITPDSANLDPDTGGLSIWDKEAPLDWDFEKFNTDESAMQDFLAEHNAREMTIPHRCNRVAAFNSDLFHASGELNFRNGYENRRVNITMLYGFREN